MTTSFTSHSSACVERCAGQKKSSDVLIWPNEIIAPPVLLCLCDDDGFFAAALALMEVKVGKSYIGKGASNLERPRTVFFFFFLHAA